MSGYDNGNPARLPRLWLLTVVLVVAVWLTLLSGCSAVPSQPVTVPKTPPPAGAMTDCNPATLPADGTLYELATALEQTAWTLSACRLGHKELRDWATKNWSQ